MTESAECKEQLPRGPHDSPRSQERFVGGVVRALLAPHVDLQRRYPDMAQALPASDWRCVAILVESIEHATALHRVLFGRPSAAVPMAEFTIVPVGAGGLPRCFLVTPSAVPSLRRAGIDVLVRADGGVGLPLGMNDDLLSVGHDAPRLLLVDIADRHHPQLRRHARWRREAYLNAGWPIGTDVPGAAELARFLAAANGRAS